MQSFDIPRNVSTPADRRIITEGTEKHAIVGGPNAAEDEAGDPVAFDGG